MNTAGDYDKRISIEAPKTAADIENAYGEIDLGDDGSWRLVARCWAEVQSQGGREVERLKQNTADLTHLIRIRWSSATKDIDPSMRIVLGERKLEIISAANVNEKNSVIEMMCREVKPA